MTAPGRHTFSGSAAGQGPAVLCTRDLKPALLKRALEAGIHIHCESYFRIEPAGGQDLIRQVRQLWDTPDLCAIFTSRHAVEAVADLLSGRPADAVRRHIYTLSGASLEAVRLAGWEPLVRTTAFGAAPLASLLLKTPLPGAAVFFAGDQRRQELPEAFAAAGVPLQECVVYHNRPCPQPSSLPEPRALLFFSPSAVEGYLAENRPPYSTPCFAIGPTTAEALARQGFREIHVSTEPRSEALLEQLIAYFTHKTSLPNGTEK